MKSGAHRVVRGTPPWTLLILHYLRREDTGLTTATITVFTRDGNVPLGSQTFFPLRLAAVCGRKARCLTAEGMKGDER